MSMFRTEFENQPQFDLHKNKQDISSQFSPKDQSNQQKLVFNVEEEIQQQQIRLKQQQVVARIKDLLGKANEKLKLTPISKENKFNNKIKIMKSLKSFVDIEQDLNKLNLLQDPAVISSINMLRGRQILDKEMKKLALQHQIDKMKSQQFAEEYLLDLDDSNIDIQPDNLNEEFKLQMVSTEKSPRQLKKAIKISNQFYQTHKSLVRAKDHINMQNQQLTHRPFATKSLEQTSNIKVFHSQSNSEHKFEFQAFYDGVENDQKDRNFETQVNSQRNSVIRQEHNQQNQVQGMKQFLEHRYIDIVDKQKIPNQMFLQDFKRRSDKMIQEAQKKSNKEYRALLIEQKCLPKTPNKLSNTRSIQTKKECKKLRIQVVDQSPLMSPVSLMSPLPQLMQMQSSGSLDSPILLPQLQRLDENYNPIQSLFYVNSIKKIAKQMKQKIQGNSNEEYTQNSQIIVDGGTPTPTPDSTMRTSFLQIKIPRISCRTQFSLKSRRSNQPSDMQQAQKNMNFLFDHLNKAKSQFETQVKETDRILSDMNQELVLSQDRYQDRRLDVDPDRQYEKYTSDKIDGKGKRYLPRKHSHIDVRRQKRMNYIFKSQLN